MPESGKNSCALHSKLLHQNRCTVTMATGQISSTSCYRRAWRRQASPADSRGDVLGKCRKNGGNYGGRYVRKWRQKMAVKDRSKAELGAKRRFLAAPRLTPVSSTATVPAPSPNSGTLDCSPAELPRPKCHLQQGSIAERRRGAPYQGREIPLCTEPAAAQTPGCLLRCVVLTPARVGIRPIPT